MAVVHTCEKMQGY